MVEKQLGRAKNTPREKPQGVFGVRCSVFGVHYYLLAGYARSSQPRVRHSLAPVAPVVDAAGTAPGAQRVARNSRGALVDTSVYLKPAKLVDVALDVLARLAPCLNLGVGELGHKDLLDTIGTDNCRK